MEVKKLAGESAAKYVANGMIVGLGTGSTAYWAIQKIGEKIKHGLSIRAIATSQESEELASKLNIPLISFSDADHFDVTIDGADEVDEKKYMIKGGGGALLREKIVASITKQYIIAVGESKLVKRLGKFPLPVEITPFAWEVTVKALENLECKTTVRKKSGSFFITDNSNYIIDCVFNEIPDPENLSREINMIPGVVENGIFLRRPDIVIVGKEDGTIKEIR
ncbi:MAG: ribose 5-phosphate isomerase A [Bacteroidetes bacterium]|nr:MAG: ribose 5-phosphate isomerase A [Bacteroidota bacterium]